MQIRVLQARALFPLVQIWTVLHNTMRGRGRGYPVMPTVSLVYFLPSVLIIAINKCTTISDWYHNLLVASACIVVIFVRYTELLSLLSLFNSIRCYNSNQGMRPKDKEAPVEFWTEARPDKAKCPLPISWCVNIIPGKNIRQLKYKYFPWYWPM